jgi:hypothetical protein
MNLIWQNNTAAQNLTWIYVNNSGNLVVGSTISPNNSHTEPNIQAEAMGFAGNWNGYQLIFFPQGGVVQASASDGALPKDGIVTAKQEKAE